MSNQVFSISIDLCEKIINTFNVASEELNKIAGHPDMAANLTEIANNRLVELPELVESINTSGNSLEIDRLINSSFGVQNGNKSAI